MPIVNNEKFEALLSSLTTERPTDPAEWQECVAIPEELVHTRDGQTQLPAISFWYKEAGDLGLSSFFKKLVNELVLKGHPADIEVATGLTAIFAFIRRNVGPAIDQFNSILNEVVEADLNPYVLFRVTSDVYFRSFLTKERIGPFHVGPFRFDRLAYQSEKANSNFHELYRSSLQTIPLSIERDHKRAKVIYWHRIITGCHLSVTSEKYKLLERLVDVYFNRLSRLYIKELFAEFDNIQEIAIGLGSGSFDINALRGMLGTQYVSIYLNINNDGAGFVSSSRSSLGELDLGGAHIGIPVTEAFLHNHFAFQSPTNESHIHKNLKIFCRFLASAARHHHSNRQDEAFLHNVVALDLLLGAEGSSTASVSTRGAILVHRAIGKSYETTVKEIKDIYNARSKYVHEGKSPDAALLGSVERVAREIAFVLFRLQRTEEHQKTWAHGQWLKDVDYLVATIDAHRDIMEADLLKVGIAGKSDVTAENLKSCLQNPATSYLDPTKQ